MKVRDVDATELVDAVYTVVGTAQDMGSPGTRIFVLRWRTIAGRFEILVMQQQNQLTVETMASTQVYGSSAVLLSNRYVQCSSETRVAKDNTLCHPPVKPLWH